MSLIVVLSACATTEDKSHRGQRALTADEGRVLVGRLLPGGIADRTGWAIDIFAAVSALQVEATRDNICAAIAITEQESGFQVDPAIPGLAAIAWKEIEKRRERLGIPKLVLDAALALPSSTGQSYGERINTVKTELQLSNIFEDFIGKVPLGERFLSDRNPVHTGGPMQVSIAFAEAQAAEKPYPYPMTGTVRHEVFTRRGGMYFGVAHLLDYPANYDRPIYRFADFNAGRYSSRNAAFQNAVTQATGIQLALDGDLLRYDGSPSTRNPSNTELALRILARRLNLSDSDIRGDLEQEKEPGFEQTRLYQRVFELTEKLSGKRSPRALVPAIALQGPKITRKLTTDWYATNVDRRFQRCLARQPT